MMKCSFQWLVCNHNDILCMSCHEYNGSYQFGVATNTKKTCSFMCFVCHHDDILDILHCWMACTLTLHLHYLFIFLCCANGAMTKNGHVIIDMLLFLAHTWVAWSLMFIGMVNSNSSTRSKHLPPCHGDEQESRTTLFKGGGDDVARITTITMSRPSTLHKPPWTSKVSSFLYLSPIPHPLDGILRHASSLDDARVTTTSTCTREDGQGARGMEPVKAEAWKRRRKKRRNPRWRYYRWVKRYYRPWPSQHGHTPRRRYRQRHRRRYRPVPATWDGDLHAGGTTAPATAKNALLDLHPVPPAAAGAVPLGTGGVG